MLVIHVPLHSACIHILSFSYSFCCSVFLINVGHVGTFACSVCFCRSVFVCSAGSSFGVEKSLPAPTSVLGDTHTHTQMRTLLKTNAKKSGGESAEGLEGGEKMVLSSNDERIALS